MLLQGHELERPVRQEGHQGVIMIRRAVMAVLLTSTIIFRSISTFQEGGQAPGMPLLPTSSAYLRLFMLLDLAPASSRRWTGCIPSCTSIPVAPGASRHPWPVETEVKWT